MCETTSWNESEIVEALSFSDRWRFRPEYGPPRPREHALGISLKPLVDTRTVLEHGSPESRAKLDPCHDFAMVRSPVDGVPDPSWTLVKTFCGIPLHLAVRSDWKTVIMGKWHDCEGLMLVRP